MMGKVTRGIIIPRMEVLPLTHLIIYGALFASIMWDDNMKKKIFIAIIICVIFLPILFQLFVNYTVFLKGQAYEMHPASQPGTIWQSEDGRITFKISDNAGWIPVTVESEHGLKEIELSAVQKTTYILFRQMKDDPNTDYADMIADGSGVSKEFDKFIITISNIYSADAILSALFEPGEKIVFRRISVPEPLESEPSESEPGSPRIRPIRP